MNKKIYFNGNIITVDKNESNKIPILFVVTSIKIL